MKCRGKQVESRSKYVAFKNPIFAHIENNKPKFYPKVKSFSGSDWPK